MDRITLGAMVKSVLLYVCSCCLSAAPGIKVFDIAELTAFTSPMSRIEYQHRYCC